MSRWKTALFAALAISLGVLVPYLLAEGLYAVLGGRKARTTLAYAAYARWFVQPQLEDMSPETRMITSVDQIRAQIDAMLTAGVGLGNSPFPELKRAAASINEERDGCVVQKPNLRKVMSFLRSNLFNPFDQMTYFADADRPLPVELQQFVDRYAFRPVHLTTNANGERITVPAVSRPDKVLVAGDSIANGAMLEDSETLASQLQAIDGKNQYVNLGIVGADTKDILCALDAAAKRYAGHIRAVVYVFCENDFKKELPYGEPEDLVAWLVRFRERAGLTKLALVYVPYIYNTVPEVTRILGHSHHALSTYADEKRRLLSLSRQAGFEVVDYLDVTNAERRATGSQFGPLALYVDHTHLSRAGIQRLLPPLASFAMDNESP